MKPEEEKEIREIVNRKCSELSEHFDSVRIFVTRHRGGEESTTSYEVGQGNFYAQYGQVVEWLSLQDQFQRNHAIRKDNEEHP